MPARRATPSRSAPPLPAAGSRPGDPSGERDPAAYVEAVLALVERIPPGRVMSYGAIAEYLYEAYGRSSPRRVGTIMAQYGGTVAWYRVVTSGGRMPPGHEARAQRLLEKEGVVFTGPHVRMASYSWWPER